MKAISLWQPWASLWLSPAKVHETRHWLTRHRGWLAIHAAKRLETDLPNELIEVCIKTFGLRWRDSLRFGAVLGAVYLDDCITTNVRQPLHDDDRTCGNWSANRFAWSRREAFVRVDPVKFRGHQGLFDIPDLIVPQLPYFDRRFA